MDKSRDTLCLCQAQLTAEESPAEPQGSYQKCFHWNTVAPSHPALGGCHQLCFAKGK